MNHKASLIAAILFCLMSISSANHVILTGGPALRKWEDLRVEVDRHDRWWANFIRASTLRMVEIRTAYGKDAPITWVVVKKPYEKRALEDGKPLVTWINDLAKRRNVKLVWVSTGKEALNAINNHSSRSVKTFDYFGHSNKYCFMLDYSADVMGASTAWIHEKDLSGLKASVFDKKSICRSWGCFTAESMSQVWKNRTGLDLIGAHGKTDYTMVGRGQMPSIIGKWVYEFD